MIIKELFEGPVGDYCISRNTIKCLLKLIFTFLQYSYPRNNKSRTTNVGYEFGSTCDPAPTVWETISS